MARPGKPTELILLEGKSHRTKDELEQRKKAEEELATGEEFKESAQVKNNKIAHKEFLRLKKLYKEISYVEGLDEQIINRYCLEISNLFELQEMIENISKKIDECEEIAEQISMYNTMVEAMKAQHKSKELLLKYEDRLFLNPTSRIKSIPKKPEKEKEKTGMEAYLERRGR